MDTTIIAIDQDTLGPLFQGAYAVHQAVEREIDPDGDPDTEAMFRKTLSGSNTFEQRVFVRLDGHDVVALLNVSLHHLEANNDKAEILLEIHPDHRRQGHGRALVAAARALCADVGRTSMVAFGPDSDASALFWESCGMEKKLVERESRLWLANTDEHLMQSWIDQRAERAASYVIHDVTGVVPHHLLEAAVHCMNAMNDAPLDELDWDPDSWTQESFLDLEAHIASMGRERWTSIVVDSEGNAAGMTNISLQLGKPRFAYQSNTSVIAEHRNRGIGRWLKAHMFQRLRTHAPEVEAINTDNAESNEPMLAINVAMGFEPHSAWGAWQAPTSALR